MGRMTKKTMTRSENMARIRSKNTSIEIRLRKALWARGFRYRVNDKTVFGKPDIVFRAKKVVIFCDSEFWHGKNYLESKYEFKTNQEYWNSKIQRNIKRDEIVNITLKDQGWTVLRFWGQDINNNLDMVVHQIISAIN